MRPYFGNFQVIEYQGMKLRNIMHSAQLAHQVLEKSSLAYPYTLQDGDTPTIIAFDYYGSVEYVWLVLLANNILDPYTDWYKSQEQFDAYIVDKYGSVANAMAEIHHYHDSDDDTRPTVTPTSYEYLSESEKIGLTPVYSYEWENSLNEPKRLIKLIDKAAAPKIAFELEKMLR
jgi:hypothetical protein